MISTAYKSYKAIYAFSLLSNLSLNKLKKEGFLTNDLATAIKFICEAYVLDSSNFKWDELKKIDVHRKQFHFFKMFFHISGLSDTHTDWTIECEKDNEYKIRFDFYPDLLIPDLDNSGLLVMRLVSYRYLFNDSIDIHLGLSPLPI